MFVLFTGCETGGVNSLNQTRLGSAFTAQEPRRPVLTACSTRSTRSNASVISLFSFLTSQNLSGIFGSKRSRSSGAKNNSGSGSGLRSRVWSVLGPRVSDRIDGPPRGRGPDLRVLASSALRSEIVPLEPGRRCLESLMRPEARS